MIVNNIAATKKGFVKVDDLVQATAWLIRHESGAARLIPEAEIHHQLTIQNICPPQGAVFSHLLKKTIDENEDICELTAGDGSRHYFSTNLMTRAYATMLLKKQGDPLILIADMVRKIAADYLRPVPLDLFTQSPFDFAYGDIIKIIEQMESLEEFQDIERTKTSISREFLYSTHFLEPMHASMLAVWIDLGQPENP